MAEHPEATFYVRADGCSMVGAGIDDKDVLVVDRSLEPANNKVAVCILDGEFTVKRNRVEKDKLYLVPENPDFAPIEITEANRFAVWGIVTYVIKKL